MREESGVAPTQVSDLLNQVLAEGIDLAGQCKQAHWNVKGPTFIALHKLFDDITGEIQEYVDLVAERVVQLGHTPLGTIRVVAQRSTLAEYPLGIVTAAEHVTALSGALAAFGRSIATGMDTASQLGDAVTADILTQIARGIAKSLWFVEAHQHGA